MRKKHTCVRLRISANCTVYPVPVGNATWSLLSLIMNMSKDVGCHEARKRHTCACSQSCFGWKSLRAAGPIKRGCHCWRHYPICPACNVKN